jgi:hypothetical protein
MVLRPQRICCVPGARKLASVCPASANASADEIGGAADLPVVSTGSRLTRSMAEPWATSRSSAAHPASARPPRTPFCVGAAALS